MKSLYQYISRHLSLRLGLLILLVVTAVFSVSLSFLFYRSRQLVQAAAVVRATEVLDSTVLKISTILDRVAKLTIKMDGEVRHHLKPDSLLAQTRQMLQQNTDIQGFTIAMEPDFFPRQGRCFSAYSFRQGDSITTVIGNYDYFGQDWYRIPWEQKHALWLESYLTDIPGVPKSSDYKFSFVKPLFGEDGRIIGILRTDFLLKWLSEAVTQVKPYPNSSAIMIDHKGRYIVHPQEAKLVRETIFSDPDPRARQDIVPLGEAMITGRSGMQRLVVDGNDAHVFFRPLDRTEWSIAIVCPDSDVFSSLNRLLYRIWAIIGLSLILLLWFCYQTIRRTITPLNRLATTTQRLAEGHFDEFIPPTDRLDTVGQLQNSFVRMQRSIHDHVSDIRQMNDEMSQRIKELHHAWQLVREADQRKTAFVQDMAHQIRTPLNIINGFTQVIVANGQELPAEELSDITDRMTSSAKAISRITRMLIATAADGQELVGEQTVFHCNALCEEAIETVRSQVPDTLNLVFSSSVTDDFSIFTDRKALLSILVELLDNAVRFAPASTITVGCQQVDGATVVFTVSDTGPGIAAANREHIFNQFTKLDTFTEGIGLGLPLSRHIARTLGGDLILDDLYTTGTRFILRLPRKEQTKTEI